MIQPNYVSPFDSVSALELRQVMKPRIRWRYHRDRAMWSWHSEYARMEGLTLGNCEEMICEWLKPFWGVE